MKNIKYLIQLTIIIISLSFIGCDENGGITIPSGATQLTVSVKNDGSVSDNPTTVTISQVKALVSQVKLERMSDSKNELLLPGPLVINFTLDGSFISIGTQYIVRDIYTKIKFQLHKPDVNETLSDSEFRTGAGENQRFSFIIKGTYNGAGFTYKSKQSASLILSFPSAENINLKKENITVLFNKLMFLRHGSLALDPNNPQNESMIDSNIKASFTRAFIDNDVNGSPDGN
jgi:hypothetical protein